MRVLKIQLVKAQKKEREKRRSGRITNKRIQKGQHHNQINNKACLPQIATKRGTLIRRRKSVPIVRRWVIMNISVIKNRLMS